MTDKNPDGSNIVDDVDISEPKPVQDLPDQPESGDVSDGAPADESDLADDEMKHVDDSGEVVGRRNEELPTENLSVPDANPDPSSDDES